MKHSKKLEAIRELDEFLSDKHESKRARAVKMGLEGYSYPLIQRLLQGSEAFIRQWCVRYTTEGIERLSLHYKGSTGSLSPTQHAEVMAFLSTRETSRVEEVRDYLESHYQVVYKSKQSYYALLHEARLSWKRTQAMNPKHDPDKVAARRRAIRQLLASRREAIDSGRLVALMEDECHLLWGDPLGDVWGRRNERVSVPIDNIKAHQTYYGAINLATRRFHAHPYPSGNSVYTVQYVKHLRALFPEAQLLLIWDGASYHQYADMRAYLNEVNTGFVKPDWKVRCELFAPNAPEQNPGEDIWLQGKNFLRKFFYKHNTFSQVNSAFQTFLETTRFEFPKLALYWDEE